jgi:hypothetical protein
MRHSSLLRLGTGLALTGLIDAGGDGIGGAGVDNVHSRPAEFAIDARLPAPGLVHVDLMLFAAAQADAFAESFAQAWIQSMAALILALLQQFTAFYHQRGIVLYCHNRGPPNEAVFSNKAETGFDSA